MWNDPVSDREAANLALKKSIECLAYCSKIMTEREKTRADLASLGKEIAELRSLVLELAEHIGG